jgi:hypothetical protein
MGKAKTELHNLKKEKYLSDLGDQNMLKNQSSQNCSKMDSCVGLVLMIPTQLEQAQTDIVCKRYQFLSTFPNREMFVDSTIRTGHVGADYIVRTDHTNDVAG